MIVKAVREGLGRLIILVDFLTRPAKIKRSAQEQAECDRKSYTLSLYQFYACPFCVKTRRAIHKLNISIPIRDAQHDQQHRADLSEGGGTIKVPCLRIEEDGETKWLYESSQIIAFLNARFA